MSDTRNEAIIHRYDPQTPLEDVMPARGECEQGEQGYLAQIEGLQRELRDANAALEKETELREQQVASAQTAWAERDAMQKLLRDTERVLKSAVTLVAYFGSKA